MSEPVLVMRVGTSVTLALVVSGSSLDWPWRCNGAYSLTALRCILPCQVYRVVRPGQAQSKAQKVLQCWGCLPVHSVADLHHDCGTSESVLNFLCYNYNSGSTGLNRTQSKVRWPNCTRIHSTSLQVCRES